MANFIDLGKIGITANGNYSETTTYEKNSIVNYNGNSWVSKKTTLGNEPQDGEYWQLFGSSVIIDNEMSDVSQNAVENKVIKEYVDGTVLVGTLEIGEEFLILTSDKIKTTSTLDFYTDDYNVSPKSILLTIGEVKLVFSPQSKIVNVKVVVH